MARNSLGESSAVIRERVIAARAIASARFEGLPWQLNSQIPSRALRTTFQLEREAMNFLHDELDKERITARGLHKISRVAWTLADLSGHIRPNRCDVEQAYQLREGTQK